MTGRDGERIFRFVLIFFIAPFGLAGDYLATSIVAFWLFFEDPESAFDAIHRFIDRWRRFYRTGEWDWDLITER